jgi:murein L,D-transpeptidase YafK
MRTTALSAAAVLLLCLIAVPCLTAVPCRAEDGKPARAEMPPYAAYILRTMRPKIAEAFAARGLKYPPRRVTFVVIKDLRRLEVWAFEGWSDPRPVKSYEVTALSGRPGPKLREGDRQVPEGIYSVLWLNPDSDFELSMKLDYPNEFDRAAAALDGRKNPGGDIFIHGGSVSAGCIAVGDDAVGEVFTLVHDVGVENVEVVVVPRDFRRAAPRSRDFSSRPKWLKILYDWLDEELHKYVEKK